MTKEHGFEDLGLAPNGLPSTRTLSATYLNQDIHRFSVLAGIPVVTKAAVPKLAWSPLESKHVCVEGEVALVVLTKVNYQTAANSFCSSFISIPDVTSGVTVTQTRPCMQVRSPRVNQYQLIPGLWAVRFA